MKITTSSDKINKAIEIAVNDIVLNICEFKSGLLREERPVLMAGTDYDRPWTRDASINTYNYIALYDGEIARNTLLSVLEKTSRGIFIGGQYWDNVIWSLGAERYIDIHGDDEFRGIALEAVTNTLALREKEEFSGEYGLFRGAAVYGDGVSAYPEAYALPNTGGCILGWTEKNRNRAADSGYGIPMHVLSTNCIYYNAYMMLYRKTRVSTYLKKAESLRNSITANFMKDGKPGYITGPLGDCGKQEGLGVSFGLMFGILPSAVLGGIRSTKHGIPCVEGTFERYDKVNDMGRHSGTIWSFINSFYANAALHSGRGDIFGNEFGMLTDKALRDGQFFEIYHPETGLPYGGIQEPLWDGAYSRLKSCEHQAWSATGYMSMILNGLAGFSILDDKPDFTPSWIADIEYIELEGMTVRNLKMDKSLHCCI